MRLCTHFLRLISLLHCSTFLALIHAFIQCKAGRNRPAEEGKVPLHYRVILQKFTHMGIITLHAVLEAGHVSTNGNKNSIFGDEILMDHLVGHAAPSSSPPPPLLWEMVEKKKKRKGEHYSFPGERIHRVAMHEKGKDLCI